MKILVCQLRNHGDIIRTFPVLDALREFHPNAWIGASCYEELVPTYQLCSVLDEVIPQVRLKPPIDDVQLTRIMDCNPLCKSVERVRELAIDVYIDFHGVFQSALFGLLANIPVRVGRTQFTTRDGAHLFYNKHALIETHEINRMYRHFVTAQIVFPSLVPFENRINDCSKSKSIIVVPGSSEQGKLKRWHSNKYIELIKRLANSTTKKIFVAFDPSESELIDQIMPQLSGRAKAIIPSSLGEYFHYFENCKCVIGNDCAPLHLAVWKRIPTFMILGPTPPAVNAPWTFITSGWIGGFPNCATCDFWKHICVSNHQCMERLSVDEVYSAVSVFLDKIGDAV